MIADAAIKALGESPAAAQSPYLYSMDEANTLFDGRSTLRKITDLSLSLLREALFVLSTCPSRITDRLGWNDRYCVPSGEGNQWRDGNEGLYVMVHGMNGHPSIWDRHLSKIQAEQPQCEVRIPRVPRKGNCSLETASEPIADMVMDYMRQNPGKPVCLLGVSNGGRVVKWIDNYLGDRDTPVKVSTIAAVHFGTVMMEILERIGLAKYLYHPSIVEDYRSGSETALKLLSETPSGLASREYDFYASTEDMQVVPYTYALPRLGVGEHHFVVHGQNHSSIVNGVRDHQLARCKEWMNAVAAR